MDILRGKLAAKLGAVKAPESKSPYIVRVASNASAPAEGTPRKPRKGASSAKALPLKQWVDEHRANKLAGAGLSGEGGQSQWTHQGEAGPSAWGTLNPAFATCATGSRQSPIDIRDGIALDLEPVQFDYKPTGFSVVDNGHTVQVNLGSGNTIQVMGRRYELQQLNFRRPSEERIQGRQFDMGAHLVHKDSQGRVAVVAVLLERGGAHPLVQAVWNNLPLEKGEELAASSALDLNQLLPQDKRYYTYMGSLTTPPCSEGVLWMVMQQPVTLSAQQIDVFSRLYPMNARPIQQAFGRLIKQSH
jgi:carbonic anhydrase